MNRKLRNGVVMSLVVLGIAWAIPGLAGTAKESPEWTALVQKMESEGWHVVAERVFERTLGATKVEHLGYGPEGLSWTIGELNRQREGLIAENKLYPSSQLVDAIDGLGAAMGRAFEELSTMPKGEGAAELYVTGGSCDPICYGATADAYHQTSYQGVGATATARFTNSCGYSGDTYAYAYARATAGTTTSTITQQDPRTGTAVTSSASANVAGGSVSGIPCYSSASAYAQSSALGISYSTSDVNDSFCPVPATPPSCSISGTNYEYFLTTSCRSRTWTANASGGVTPYTYQWTVNGAVVGSASTYTRSICPLAGSFTVGLTVTGANGLTCNSSIFVVVDYEPDPCLNAIAPCQ